MRRFQRVLLISVLLATILSPIQASSVVATNPTPDCTAGSTCTVTFTYTGDYYSWTVPAGIASVTVDAFGAQGGNTPNVAGGGKGGRVQATLAVTSGATLFIYVGGQGASNSNGGYNGGGTANGVQYGASGGGATHIATASGLLSTLSASQSSVLLAAGGGGGSGYYNGGGAGGGLTGGKGTDYNATWTGGSGGTQSAGGAAGNAYCSSPVAGSFGQGGGNGSYHCTGGGGGWYGGGQGAVGGGGGGSSYTNATYSSSITHTQGSRSGNGQASFTYLNAPVVTNFTTSQTTPTSSSVSITYSLTFSQNVNSVSNADFTNSGTATGCSFAISASSGSTFTLTVSSCSEGTLVPQVLANSVFGTVTSSNGPAANSLTTTPIRIDRTAPTISSVAAPSNSTYSNNQTPTFTMVFSESVTVTGTPRLTLTVGSVTKYASYLSMSDSKTALFRYTVTTDPLEFDTDGIAVSTTLDLNSGSISDLATNTISNLSFSAPTLTSVFVAQLPVAPTIDSVTATSGTLTIYFTPGAARGSTTSSYQYTTDNNTFKNLSPASTGSPMVITTISNGATNLVNGTGYQIRIRAVTNAGNSSISNLVIETPTAVSVSGDSTLTLTYGNSASTSSYSATGGTNTYTWSLASVISGVTLSGTTVTASNTLAAGTYSQTVRATDGNSQVGTRSLTITVNKASTSISIALPNSATSAALGGAITITATVSRAGSVNFQLGGSTISGCGSAAAASTSATCSWTPASLGSASLTAIFTPTDSSNFETSTTSTLTITVVNGVSTVTLSLTGGVTTAPKGQAINIIAAVDQAGRVTFFIDGKRVPRCINRSATVGNVTCSWKPAVQKAVTISARLTPSNNVYNASSSSMNVQVVRRSGAR